MPLVTVFLLKPGKKTGVTTSFKSRSPTWESCLCLFELSDNAGLSCKMKLHAALLCRAYSPSGTGVWDGSLAKHSLQLRLLLHSAPLRFRTDVFVWVLLGLAHSRKSSLRWRRHVPVHCQRLHRVYSQKVWVTALHNACSVSLRDLTAT